MPLCVIAERSKYAQGFIVVILIGFLMQRLTNA